MGDCASQNLGSLPCAQDGFREQLIDPLLAQLQRPFFAFAVVLVFRKDRRHKLTLAAIAGSFGELRETGYLFQNRAKGRRRIRSDGGRHDTHRKFRQNRPLDRRKIALRSHTPSNSGDYRDGGAFRSPVIEKLSDIERQVNTPMTHWRAEVAVPVGAMNGVAEIVEIHHPWNVLDLVVLVADRSLHRLRIVLDQNGVVADRGYGFEHFGSSRTDECFGNKFAALVSPECLRTDGHNDLFVGALLRAGASIGNGCRFLHDFCGGAASNWLDVRLEVVRWFCWFKRSDKE